MFKNQRDLEGKIRQTESEKSRLRYVLVCVLILLSSLLAISYQKRISVGKQAASQKQIEAILRRTNKQWKETFDGLEDAICTTSKKGNLVLCNDSFADLFEISDLSSGDISIKELIEEFLEPCVEPFKGIHRMKFLKEGFEKWFRIHRMDPDEFSGGETIYVIRDVSADVEIQKEYAMQSQFFNGSTKSDFVAVASHEIRTPLAVISGSVELMSMANHLDDETRKHLQLMDNASTRLQRLVDDLLDFSKAENGKMFLANSPFDIRQTVEICVNPIRLQRPELDLKVELAEDLPSRVSGDAIRYGQVLSNLLNNAEFATREGGITVSVRAKSAARKSICLTTTITDTGEGVPEEKRELIFEPFEQGSNSRKRKKNGLGLGLSICRKICESMGGDLKLLNSSTEGSVFSFDCLFHELSVDKNDLKPGEHANQLNVLVVDDDDFCRVIVSDMIKNLGHQVTQASNGAEAIELIEAGSGDFDAVFMDIMMPDMSGIEAIKELRKKYAADELVVIALSATSQSNDRQFSRFSGFNCFLRKPVSLDELAEALKRFALSSARSSSEHEKVLAVNG